MPSSSSSVTRNTREASNLEEGPWLETDWNDAKFCHCGLRCPLMTSWTRSNPGRRFWSCSNAGSGECAFFEWKDAPHSPWSKRVILHLMDERVSEPKEDSLAAADGGSHEHGA